MTSLTPLKVVKVGNFGLAVNGYTSKHWYVQDDDAKPIRYLAPEALEKGRYSEQSDVWSFGVLAWELLTDGKRPYFELIKESDVVKHVVGGGRLPRPTAAEHCPSDELWLTIESCWTFDRKKRPSFENLVVSVTIRGGFFRELKRMLIQRHLFSLYMNWSSSPVLFLSRGKFIVYVSQC